MGHSCRTCRSEVRQTAAANIGIIEGSPYPDNIHIGKPLDEQIEIHSDRIAGRGPARPGIEIDGNIAIPETRSVTAIPVVKNVDVMRCIHGIYRNQIIGTTNGRLYRVYRTAGYGYPGSHRTG